MTFIPKPHEIYKHFKGNLYQVVTIAEHSETGEQLVIYQALYGEFKTYARPLAMFTGEVDRKKYPEVAQRFRFELQGAEADRQIRETDAAGVAQAAGAQMAQNVAAQATTAQPATTQATATAAQPIAAQSATAQTTPTVGQATAAPTPDSAQAASAQPATAPTPSAEDEEPALDPMVLEFLDADSYEQKLNILAGLHHRITNEMITTMAISCDIEVNDGEPEERYEELKNCLLTMEKFECNRLR